MITKTITNEYEFAEWLKRSGSYSNNFSLKGAKALQAYLEELSEDLGENIEFDPVAWCVEYTEFSSAWEAMEQYQPEDMPVEGEEGDDLTEIQEKNEQAALEWLQDRTTVIEFDDGTVDGRGIIIADFFTLKG